MVLNGGVKVMLQKAFKRVIKFLFEEVEVETIYAEHLEANPASGRVM